MDSNHLDRRQWLRAAGAALACSPCLSVMAADPRRIFKIGTWDWSIGQRGKLEAMAVAKKIGFPVIIKAVAGGGGKGMRTAHNAVAFKKEYNSAIWAVRAA